MTRVMEFFMQRRTLFYSLLATILIAGVLSFVRMPKLEDPEVVVKQAMVVVPYPGATAHEVELQVALPMEEVLRTLPRVQKIKSECRNDMAMLTVEYQMDVANSEIEQYFDLLRRKVGDSKGVLPQGCYDPVVVDDMMDIYGILYGITAEGYSYSEMERYAKYIKRELLTVKGVKRVSIGGTRREVIDITLPQREIAANGLLPTQIMMALNTQGTAVNAGSLNQGDQRLKLIVSEGIADERQIADLRVSTLTGQSVRLGDIAEVRRTYATPQTNGLFIDGKEALSIGVSLEAGAVVPDVGKEVDKKLQEVAAKLPAGFETQKIYFQPDQVSSAISDFMLNLLESVLIVIVALIFTMGLRSGAIIGLGLVLTIALSFPILLNLGTTLQRISLGAFIVAMGMLVDNAIVIMDGILVDKGKGLPKSQYLTRIGKQTAWPLLGATVIAAATFICIYMSPGTVGEYAGDLFLVLCVSLLCSWLLALVQVPICVRDWMKDKPATTSVKPARRRPWHGWRSRFERLLAWMIGHKAASGGIALGLLALAGVGFTGVKNIFFPDFNYPQFVVEYTLPSGTSPERVKRDLLSMTDLLHEEYPVNRVTASMGTAPARYCLVRPMTNGGDNYGELIVDCADYKSVVEMIPRLRDELRMRYPDAYVRLRKYNFSVSTSHPVEVEFSGSDPAVLRQLSAQAEEVMRGCPLVDAYSVQNNWGQRERQLVAQYNETDAQRAGVGRSDVGGALLAATQGKTIGVINDRDQQVLVNLRVDAPAIDNTPVWSMLNLHPDQEKLMMALGGVGSDGDALLRDMVAATPLSAVVSGIDQRWDEPVVLRLNGVRAIEAECDPNPAIETATAASVLSAIQKELDQITLPEGYKMRLVGEGEIEGDAINGLMKYVPLTLLLVIGVLLLLFNSWKQVALIFSGFPFVICGIVPLLLITGLPLTFMALIGLMGLLGMMVKNSIVLMDEVNRLVREEGQDRYHAVIAATLSRVRPVSMASLTTIVGMLPLLGDPMYCSMAAVIIGGLAVGILATLLLIPLFYTMVYKVKAV